MSWQSGDPEARPTVYLPQSDGATPSAYETYADPAEAHGWQKVYADGEATAALPVVPGDPAGRQERLLNRRRTRRGRLNRRLAVAGGAVGVVVLGLAVSGVFDSGAAKGPAGTPASTREPVRLPTGPVQADDGSTGTASARPLEAPPATTSAPAASSSAPGGTATTTASAPGTASTAPAPSATTAAPSASPSSSATGATGGRGRGQGRGHGGWSD
ncbi:hypothetical protein [Streptomyces sp. NPDC058751]|uniref:hypothetical protein n=1 Tax=Streptomyces sp. NPDC058751 TaxID=3346623 RepID=UPI00367DD080